MKIFISGAAGFIGFSLAKSLLSSNDKIDVYGIDNFDNYYSKKIKNLRIKELKKFKNFKFTNLDITKRNKVFSYFKKKNLHT